MQIQIKGTHIKLTPALKSHAETKLAGSIEPLISGGDSQATRLEIELRGNGTARDHRDKECRVSLTLPRKKTIHVTEVHEDLYTAVDLVQDKLLTVLKRTLEKARETRKDVPAA